VISLVTVPNTGTIYTLDLLRRWGVEVERKHLENLDAPPYGNERFGPGFPCPSSDEWAAYPDGRRIVCTLRDPLLAVISSINRRRPDRMISVDGWAVMAAWWEDPRPLDVHFFPIPPTRKGLVELARFAGASMGWMHTADMTPKNTSDDPRWIRRAYVEGRELEHPTLDRAAGQLLKMPAVENLFADHGIDLPWFRSRG
jgi:hypothetical protein